MWDVDPPSPTPPVRQGLAGREGRCYDALQCIGVPLSGTGTWPAIKVAAASAVETGRKKDAPGVESSQGRGDAR